MLTRNVIIARKAALHEAWNVCHVPATDRPHTVNRPPTNIQTTHQRTDHPALAAYNVETTQSTEWDILVADFVIQHLSELILT